MTEYQTSLKDVVIQVRDYELNLLVIGEETTNDNDNEYEDDDDKEVQDVAVPIVSKVTAVKKVASEALASSSIDVSAKSLAKASIDKLVADNGELLLKIKGVVVEKAKDGAIRKRKVGEIGGIDCNPKGSNYENDNDNDKNDNNNIEENNKSRSDPSTKFTANIQQIENLLNRHFS